MSKITNFNNDDNENDTNKNQNNTSGNANNQSSNEKKDETNLDFLVNLNEKMKQKEKDGVVKKLLFRDDVLFNMETVLTTMMHPNPMLIGGAGTGKTAIVEELARQIAMNEPTVPDKLKDKIIYLCDLNSIVSGASLLGQLEGRINDIIEFAKNPENNAILYIDEIHQLVNSAKEQTMGGISQQLKPELSRGDLHIIGSTTTQEYKKMSNDPALKRRFTEIIVDEFTNEQTFEILKDVKSIFENWHNVEIPESILNSVIALANKHIKNTHRPDSVLTLLDKASSTLSMKALNIQSTIRPIVKLSTLEDAIKQTNNLSNTDYSNTSNNYNNLKNVIIGQDNAIKQVAAALASKSAGLFSNDKPTSMLFAGPSGTGKTELTKQMAKLMYGSEKDMIYINMTEFVEPSSISKLLGAANGYIGSDSNQEMPLDKLTENPNQIVLLDEFEKAHESIKKLFMQALDEGLIKDNKNQEINFKNATIIATTNAGQIIEKSMGFGQTAITKESIMDSLSTSFPLELLNRFENIIQFEHITIDNYKEIVKLQYEIAYNDIKNNRPDLTLTPNPSDVLTNDYEFIDEITNESYVSQFNGRPAKNAVRKFINNEILNTSEKSIDFEKKQQTIVIKP